MTAAIIGHGAAFARGNGADPEVYTTVAEVRSIGGISITKDVQDATHMASTGRYEEIVAGIRRTGEITIELNWTKAETTLGITDVEADVASNFRVTFPDTSTWIFAAHCVGIDITASTEDLISMTATFKPTGAPSFTAAT